MTPSGCAIAKGNMVYAVPLLRAALAAPDVIINTAKSSITLPVATTESISYTSSEG